MTVEHIFKTCTLYRNVGAKTWLQENGMNGEQWAAEFPSDDKIHGNDLSRWLNIRK